MENNMSFSEKSLKKRKIKDVVHTVITCVFSSFGFIALLAMLIFIFSKGFSQLSWKMITSDYYATAYYATCTSTDSVSFDLEDTDDTYYSTIWGIGLTDSTDYEGDDCVEITYIDNLSPLKDLSQLDDYDMIELETGYTISRVQVKTTSGGNAIATAKKYGAEGIRDVLDEGYNITELYYATVGGGIRGSIVTTAYLIALTLLFSLPIGVIAAIYLGEYAKNNRFTRLLRMLIDMIAGVPSIIFGLVGLVVFVPIVNSITGESTGSIMAGSLTMAVMLLPIIIRTTEEAINTIPKSYKSASLALGASETQTTFKIILPNAIPGILVSTLLAVSKIIGESAALILVIGTSIQDSISVSGSSTSLAVHIWSLMASDNPNYSQACAISIIILALVFVFNLVVKIIGKKLNKFEVS